jgi:uncharacterized protein YbjT (DUF2867 family)
MPETAFVAGATGFTGREVVRILASKGVKTVAHVRPDSKSLAQWRTSFEKLGASVDTTAWSVEALTATFKGLRPTLVFALLGTTRKRMGRAEKEGAGRESAGYERVDYGMTKMLMDAAVAAGIRPRFVYLSAIGSGPRAAGAYMKARWKAETALRESGLPYTIARPAFISGDRPEDSRPFEKVGGAFFDGVLGVAGLVGAKRIAARYRSITNTDLAGALVRLSLDPDAANQVVERDGLVQ